MKETRCCPLSDLRATRRQSIPDERLKAQLPLVFVSPHCRRGEANFAPFGHRGKEGAHSLARVLFFEENSFILVSFTWFTSLN